jgi:arylsulfatase
MIPTFMAAVGDTDIKEKLKKGYTVEGKKYKVHLDGYNMMPYFKGEVKKSPRREIFYFDQAGNLNAVRVDDWKAHFALLQGNITDAYRLTPAWPRIVNLRADPFEKGMHESELYIRWMADNMWMFVPAQAITARFLATFKEFPPVRGSSLSIDQVLKILDEEQPRQ